jgi:hypothetical protein
MPLQHASSRDGDLYIWVLHKRHGPAVSIKYVDLLHGAVCGTDLQQATGGKEAVREA